MEQAKSMAWKAVAALAVLFLVGTALLMSFARTTPAQQNARAAQAAGLETVSGTQAASGAAAQPGHSAPAASGAATETQDAQTAGQASTGTAPAQPPTSQGQVDGQGEAGALEAGASTSEEEQNAAPVVHPAFDVSSGAELYAAACQSCHMAEGIGAENGAGTKNYPALAGNQNLQAAVYPATFILNGAGAMPSFADQLTDEQVAALVNYLRQDLNDFEGETTAAEIEPLRKGARSTELGDDAG